MKADLCPRNRGNSNSKSIFQAVLIAARRGLLDAAIFHPDEVIGTRPRIAGWDVLQVFEADLQDPKVCNNG